MDKWFARILIKVGILKPDTRLYVLAYVLKKATHVEYFFNELQANKRATQLSRRLKRPILVNTYPGVHNTRTKPIVVEDTKVVES